MFKYIDKIYTFLVVYENGSFSKAAKSLKISQPAVTQKIKQLEEFIGVTVIERKKNGIILTSKGRELLDIAKKLDFCITDTFKKVRSLRTNVSPLVIGASSTVGNYILPKYMPYIKSLISKEINLVVKNNSFLIEHLLNNEIEMAFTTVKINNPLLEYIPFKDDKIVFFSNKPLPSSMDFDDLLKYEFICREDGSSLKNEVSKIFKKYQKDCSLFNIISYVDNSTALIFTLLNSHKQYISLISYEAIKHYVKSQQLFVTKIKNIDLHRKIYIVVKKENRTNNTIDNIIKYLLEQ